MYQSFCKTILVKSRAGIRSISGLMAFLMTFGFVGCGGDDFKPQLGLVTGSVTVNGAPGADLLVTFEPQGGGKSSLVGMASTATTDGQGKFELNYGGNSKGAVVGKHLVRIVSAAGGGPAGGETGAAPVLIPENYNTSSTLTANVVAGDNPPAKFELQIPK